MKPLFSSIALSSTLLSVQAAPAPHDPSRRGLFDSFKDMQSALNNATTNATRAAVPFYDTTANGFKGPARGWNSFGLQSMGAQFAEDADWAFDDEHVRQHCDLLEVQDGFDYVCSVDSGWSVDCEGDDNGIPKPTDKFPDIKGLADHLHGKGIKLGLYVVPGAFNADASKTIKDSDIHIGSLFDPTKPTPLCRGSFDYARDGVQQWHDSVVAKFIEWGVDMIKVDYITPGSPDAGQDLPTDNSGTVKAYHQAIINNKAEGKLRIDISWKLDRDGSYWDTWQSNADSLRLDQDINQSGKDAKQLTTWQQVLRTIDLYRQFINEQRAPDRRGKAIKIRPDMDSIYVGNPEALTGLSDVQRYTMAIHWVGAGANLMTGSDMNRMDSLGSWLLNDPEVYGPDGVAAFTQQYPMYPRNPSDSGTIGGNRSTQHQAWIAGPTPENKALVVLANYGPDPCYNKACATYNHNDNARVNVNITLNDLGLGSIAQTWNVNRVWGGGGSGGADHSKYQITKEIECWLGPGESVMYFLDKEG